MIIMRDVRNIFERFLVYTFYNNRRDKKYIKYRVIFQIVIEIVFLLKIPLHLIFFYLPLINMYVYTHISCIWPLTIIWYNMIYWLLWFKQFRYLEMKNKYLSNSKFNWRRSGKGKIFVSSVYLFTCSWQIILSKSSDKKSFIP